MSSYQRTKPRDPPPPIILQDFSSPTLLSLESVTYIRDLVRRAKPRLQLDDQGAFEDFLPDRRKTTGTDALYHNRTAAEFASTLEVWAIRIRTRKFKSIIFIAITNNSKAEYNHLDAFGVTIIPSWNRDVRIVQGLVNLKTRNTGLRVSPVQQFPSCSGSRESESNGSHG
ncbi:hypothetical protein MY11210_008700 [Beauveria gryllotalpidicola]